MPKTDVLLLDTHVLIWLMSGEDSPLAKTRALAEILRCGKSGGIRVSAISVWEVAMLEAKGRVGFSVPVNDWIEQALGAPGVGLVPLIPAIAVDATRLPGVFHADPADRILVATARHLQCPVVTADREILGYAEKGFVRALAIK